MLVGSTQNFEPPATVAGCADNFSSVVTGGALFLLVQNSVYKGVEK